MSQPILQLGSRGLDVKILQAGLNAAGFHVNAVDGIFGLSTYTAVADFQNAKGLRPDGVVGPATWAVLNALTPGHTPNPSPEQKLYGIDVSGYDPHTDWGLVAGDGVSWAYIKATEGYSYHNPYLATDWRASRAAGIPRGVYHFFRPADDGKKQAEHMLSVLGHDTTDMLVPVIDWEVSDGVSGAKQIQGILDFNAHVKSVLGINCKLYYSASWPANFDGFGVFDSFYKWIAQYGPKCTVPFDVWQYTDKSKIAGVQALVDESVFFGTLDQFKAKFVVK